MPTYDYLCKECGYAFEEFQSMSAEQLTMCPECGKASLKRLMGAGAGMVFKGSGFYLTDYKKSGSSTSSSTAPAAPAGSSDTSKPAPASKPESTPPPPSKPSSDKS